MADSKLTSRKSTKKTLFSSSHGGVESHAGGADSTSKVTQPSSSYTVRKSVAPMNDEVLEMLKSSGKLFSLKFTDDGNDEIIEEEELADETEDDLFEPSSPDNIENYYEKNGILRKRDSPDAGAMAETEEQAPSTPERLHGLKTPDDSRIELLMHQKTYVTIFESLALYTILEEVCLQLTILGHSFPGTFVMSEDADFLTYDERFSMEVAEKDLEYIPTLKNFKNPFIIDQATVGTHEERSSVKIQKDRAFLQEIIHLAQEEIIENRSYEKLKDNVTREDGRRHEEITLLERERKAHQSVVQMLQKIKEFKLQMERDEHNRKEMINHLKDQLHQEKQKGLQNARYTRAWFEAKNTFNFGELEHRADLNRLKIKELEVQMTRDRLSHKNIEAWSNLMFAEIQGRIDDWSDKFEKDLEELEKKIRDKNDLIRGQQTMIEGLTNTIAQRMIELGPWEEEKERERQERITNLRLYYAARKIQRWWRAYMRKHKLYKKRKGRKGKGGKKRRK